MTMQPSPRDLDLLSIYLDGQLSATDRARLEARLQADPDLRSVYDGLRQTRALLRQLPARRAPRNFRLTPQMAGVKLSLPRSFPIFRFASVLASILLFIGYAINLSASPASMAAPTTMAYDSSQAPAYAEMATEAPFEVEPTATVEGFAPKLAPSATLEALPTQQNALEETATAEQTMGMAVQSTETMPQTNMDVAPEDGAAGSRLMPQPSTLPIHPGWLFGLLGLAVVSGASAFIVRNQQQKLTTRDIWLLIFAFAIVLLLAAGIYWMFVR